MCVYLWVQVILTSPPMVFSCVQVSVCDNLFSLYTDVNSSIDGWKQLTWSQVLPIMEDMLASMDGFNAR